MSEADELRSRLERTLRRMALSSTVPARLLVPAVSRAKPGSAPPQGERSRAEQYALDVELAGDDVRQLRALLRHADDELAGLLRRPLTEIRVETLEELEARVVDVGEGFEAIEVAIALHTSEAIVRRARMKAARDAERGRRLPDAVVNGAPLRFGLGLIDAGYPLRVAAELSGIAKSTLHDYVRRATDATWPRA